MAISYYQLADLRPETDMVQWAPLRYRQMEDLITLRNLSEELYSYKPQGRFPPYQKQDEYVIRWGRIKKMIEEDNGIDMDHKEGVQKGVFRWISGVTCNIGFILQDLERYVKANKRDTYGWDEIENVLMDSMTPGARTEFLFRLTQLDDDAGRQLKRMVRPPYCDCNCE